MPDSNAPTPGPTPTATVINAEHTRAASSAPAPAPHSADEAVDKTQEALRKLDEALAEKAAASIVTPTPTAAQEEATPPAQSLSEADQSLAQDLDQILQGDAATVNAVLDDVFKEQAAVVQQLDESPRPAEPPLPAAPQALAAPLATPMATVDEPAPAAPALANVASAPPSPPASPPESIPATPDSAAPVASQFGAPAVPVAVTSEQKLVAAASLSAVPTPEVVAASVEIASASTPTHMDSTGEPASESKLGALKGVLAKVRVDRTRGLASVLEPIVNVLVIINSPLRRIPTSLRPMVDWLALSLLAWVPIVWVLAIFLGHKSAPPAAAPLKTDGIAIPTLHQESTNAGPGKHK